MKRRSLLVAVTLALLAAGTCLFLPAPNPHAAPEITTAPPTAEEDVSLRTNHDLRDVFQRAFWRHPNADDRILHAERREWVSKEDGVLRWQWFLAVEPGAALDRWLREENAFGLAKVADGTGLADLGQAPSWFPEPSGMAGCEIHRAAGKMLTLIFDPAGKVLYASDVGHGFAIPRKPSVIAPHVTSLEAGIQPRASQSPR